MVGETLFPKIGEIVEQADRIQTADEPTLADDERVVEEIESLCMKCHEQVRSLLGGLAFHSGSNQGVTRLMLTSIPYFREVILMSFRCENCGFSNNEIQSAGAIRRTYLFLPEKYFRQGILCI